MNYTKFLRFAAVLLILAGLVSCDKKNEKWTVQLKLKPQADESYLATENPKIQALVSKHKVKFYQSYTEYNVPVFLLYYTLTGNSNKENTIRDFFDTGMFENKLWEGCIHFYCGVRLKLKPQEDENYLATEDPEIQALVVKHGVAFRQTYPGPKSTPELLLFYSITNEYYLKINMVTVVKDFLATGKFEDDFIASEDIHPALL